MLSLTKKQARKLIVLSNDFHHNKKAKSISATLDTFKTLGYVQIDTISVVNRAHLHILWSRNHHFNEAHLDKLFEDKQIFEYWSHAASMLPIKDYKYSLIRKQQFANGDKHWFDCDESVMTEVKEIIVNEGPRKSSDFKHQRNSNKGWWDWKPAKKALEQLYMQGDLMVLKRQGFQKVYDLTKNVLPVKLTCDLPTNDEYCRYLIKRYLLAQGIGTAENMAYLLKGLTNKITKYLQSMSENKELIKVSVNNQIYFALPEKIGLLNKRLQENVHILSPFDNLVIQRKRLIELFDFDYQIECYVPAKKRKYGYFCLPILYGDKLVARLDCKAHKQEKILRVNDIFYEKKIRKTEKFRLKMDHALSEFAAFNHCNQVMLK